MKKLLTILLLTLSFNVLAYPVVDEQGQPPSVGTPTMREDGVTPVGLSEIDKITAYCGTAQGDYIDEYITTTITLPKTPVTIDRPAGISYCVFTVTDIAGRQSLYSNEVTVNTSAEYRLQPPDVPQGTVYKITITLPVN